MNIFALIVAAGTGERFGAEGLKQLVPVAGMPMLAWSVKRLGDRRNLTGLVCVVPPGREKEIHAGLREFGGNDIDVWADGGATRQDSVRRGLAAMPAEATHVLIHDAARPCVSVALIARLTDALRDHRAVVPVVPAVDTLVRVTDGRVQAVVDRAELGRVQTPQAFELGLIRSAHAFAKDTGMTASDDGSLVLALEEPVVTVPGDRQNLKVTFESDVALADAILLREKELSE